MKRTQISLEDEDRELLDAVTARTGRSMSALIRDAVRVAYGTKDDPEADLASLRAGFASWGMDRLEGDDYVEALRTGERWKQLAE